MNTNKEILSRLKFLAKIEIGQKIDIKNMTLQADGIYTQIQRMIYQENRNKSLVFLQDTINKAFEILKCYEISFKNSDRIMCLNIISDLKDSKNGLYNLKETYSGAGDIKFGCDINVLLQMIDAKLSELETCNFLKSPLNTPPPPPLLFQSEL